MINTSKGINRTLKLKKNRYRAIHISGTKRFWRERQREGIREATANEF